MAQQQQLQGASGLTSAPVFAAVVESKRRQASDTSKSVHKVARLRELQSRLSPVRSALSLQNYLLESRVEGMHVHGSSPLVAFASVPSTSVLPLHLRFLLICLQLVKFRLVLFVRVQIPLLLMLLFSLLTLLM